MTKGACAMVAGAVLPPGWCLTCRHHEDDHHPVDGFCEIQAGDHEGCPCDRLALCAACEGDPEAHDLHVCGRA